MGVGAMKKAFVLIGYQGRGPRRTGRPSLGKGRNPVSKTPHGETGTLSSTIFAPRKALGTTAQHRQRASLAPASRRGQPGTPSGWRRQGVA